MVYSKFQKEGEYMKIIALLSLLVSSAVFANEDCKDKNFNGLELGIEYNKLQYHKRFKKLYEGDSPAPVGYDDFFGDKDSLCKDVMATYLKHYKSDTTYIMYTTHEDYCDGGNTIGIIIDYKKYQSSTFEDAIVAEIGDSGVYCK